MQQPRRPGARARFAVPRWLRPVIAVVAVLVLLIVWSLGRALLAPGTDSAAARVAEWGRNHALGPQVTWLERVTYRPPKVGGAPPSRSPLYNAPVPVHQRSAAAALPRQVAPLARPAVAGEGQWHMLSSVHGRPALMAAYLRPDRVHTSYVAGLVWMNPVLVRVELHPGTLDPGGSGWGATTGLAGHRAGLLAAFNSGFRLRSSQGGYYQNGRYAAPLRAHAASLVFFRNGSATVAEWGRDARMTPSVAAVRQNLALLVDHNRLVPGIDTNAGNAWGATLGNAKYVWRSGIGVTGNGKLVYVAGNRLSAQTLAELLRHAGSVRAMELDINPEWTSFVRYPSPGAHSARAPVNLLPDMQHSPARYDAASSRDFIALYSR